MKKVLMLKKGYDMWEFINLKFICKMLTEEPNPNKLKHDLKITFEWDGEGK